MSAERPGWILNLIKDLLVAFAVGRYAYVFALANGWQAPDYFGIVVAGLCLMWVDFDPGVSDE